MAKLRCSWPGKPKTPRGGWAYHATFHEHLSAIRRLGLVPRAVSKSERRAEWEDQDGVYFIAPFDAGTLEEYGPVWLRFPHPKEWVFNHPNPDLYSIYEAITESVPAGSIEVYTKRGRWEPLLCVSNSDVYDADDDARRVPVPKE